MEVWLDVWLPCYWLLSEGARSLEVYWVVVALRWELLVWAISQSFLSLFLSLSLILCLHTLSAVYGFINIRYLYLVFADTHSWKSCIWTSQFLTKSCNYSWKHWIVASGCGNHGTVHDQFYTDLEVMIHWLDAVYSKALLSDTAGGTHCLVTEWLKNITSLWGVSVLRRELVAWPISHSSLANIVAVVLDNAEQSWFLYLCSCFSVFATLLFFSWFKERWMITLWFGCFAVISV